jgi:hypothetical protein
MAAMTELLMNLGKLAIGFLCILGPVALLMAFLRSRDRREAVLSAKVLQELNSPELRGLYSVTVRSRLIGADKVIVDLWGCSRDQVWDLMERLSARLPADMRVAVNGISNSRLNSKVTLAVENKPRVAYCGA